MSKMFNNYQAGYNSPYQQPMDSTQYQSVPQPSSFVQPYMRDRYTPFQYAPQQYQASQPIAQQPSPQQAQPQPQMIRGRTVNADGEIMPNEVPLDGGVSIFPLSDYSGIYAKQWMPNGTIRTVKYVPMMDPGESDTKAKNNDDILARLDRIERLLSGNKTARVEGMNNASESSISS